MTPNTKRVTVLLAVSVIALVSVFFLMKYYVAQQQLTVAKSLENSVINQELLLVKLSDLTRINGADEATAKIIIDCSATERQRFDVLLDSLSTAISDFELNELNTLFYKCGGFYADRKAVMATRLTREVEVLAEYMTLQSTVSGETANQSKTISAWSNVADGELKTAEYFNTLVTLQGKIITELRAGKKATAPEIVATLSEVSKVRGQMMVLSKQIEVSKSEALAL
jgi:uncharacterized protein YgiM (DUF1202 family)